ncbi:SusD/RagB family nutrient-binding outer membrane lipoprotein [Mucilaginibacter terrigena]|uniref:SusD/RagB family nutrient-binding outer membrane lipoprotein n=1 Tax=Mucilaginibacter terrigena TaxID=2492395 RepID=A0A4Q5LRZ7_9SPHI|nr:SusD/RagB family nutrient-binding outer membrane lipoprotein [Mucilaginibacter terrigena]RYU92153.1 SusD/RagB family nutrient-binding outer membrane lipoprotein [Mucilaginibacter terrigena]
MKKIIYTLTALLTISIASSCKKFIDINDNPNAPTSVEASTLLPPMLAGMARGNWYDSRYIGQYAQIWGSASANNVWDQEGYVPGSDSGGEMWRTVYFSLGQNVTLMWEDAKAKSKYDYIGVVWALRAWGWQNGGDEYNNMIVKEAFDPTKLTFNYDSPEYVYAEVVKDCQLALNYLNLAIKTDGNTSADLAKGDYMYYGDRTKWVKFVYAILAQNMLHQSNKTTFDADLVKKYADSSFVSNADNASVQCTGSQSGDANFWGPTRANIPSFRQSDYIVRLLDGRILAGSPTQDKTLDPRLPLLLTASKDGTYRGVVAPLGDPNTADANTAIPAMAGATTANSGTPSAKYIFNDNSRGVLMTYPEVQFFVAEALFKKGDKDGAHTAYLNGIKGALDFASNPPIGSSLTGTQNYISESAKTAYLTGPAVRQDAASLQLSDILQQKYISLFVWGAPEAWSDMRRYEYDQNIFQGYVKPTTIYPDNGGKQVYLLRPRYNSEYIWNIPALKLIGALDPDYHTKKPWFVLP